MSYINWGNESPEQLALRRRMEEEYMRLMEQAANFRARAGQAPGVGGGSKVNKSKPYTVTTKQSAIFFFSLIGVPTYQYYFLNYKTDELIGPVDTGILVEEYSMSYANAYTVDSSGYAFRISTYEDYSVQKVMFINSLGVIVDTIDLTTIDLEINDFDGRYILATDFDAGLAWVFDGDTLRLDTTILSGATSFNVGSSWQTTSPFGVVVYVETGSIFRYYLVNESASTLIFATNESNRFELNAGTLYNNLILCEKNPLTEQFLSFKVIDRAGTVLHTVDLSALSLVGMPTVNFYGDNRVLLYHTNPSEIKVYQHFGDTNQLKSTTISRGGTDYFDLRYYSYSLASFRSYPLMDSFLFVLYKDDGYSDGFWDTTECRFIAFFDRSTPVTTVFTNGSSKKIALDDIEGTNKYFVVPVDTGNGTLSAAIIKQSGVTYHDLGALMSELEYGPTLTVVGSRIRIRIPKTDDTYQIHVFSDSGNQFTPALMIDQNSGTYTANGVQLLVEDLVPSSTFFMLSNEFGWNEIPSQNSEYHTRTSFTTPGFSVPGVILRQTTEEPIQSTLFTSTDIVSFESPAFTVSTSISKRLIVGCHGDLNEDLVLSVYDLNGTLLHTIVTQKSILYVLETVEDRVMALVGNKVFDGEEIFIYHTLYMITPEKVNRIDLASNTFDFFRYEINDWAYND